MNSENKIGICEDFSKYLHTQNPLPKLCGFWIETVVKPLKYGLCLLRKLINVVLDNQIENPRDSYSYGKGGLFREALDQVWEEY
jgi:hypothetical protein